MTIDKKINYEIQGGAKNYLGKQKQVQAPIKWKSSPDSPETELAYITKAEKDLLVKKDLHGSLNGDVNRGPSGIMSLDGYGSFDGPDPSKDTGMSGAATSAAESGGGSGSDARELASESQRVTGGPSLPPGVVNQNAQDYRNAFINAGGGQRVNAGFFDSRNTISPAELAMAKAYRQDPSNRFGSRAYRNTRGGFGNFISSGGIMGNLIRGLGQKFGFGKTYDEPTYDMSEFNNLGLDGINPATLDFDPNARISNTSFTQGTIPSSYTTGSIPFNPGMTTMYGNGITETQPFGNPDNFTSDIAPQFQDQAVNIGLTNKQKNLLDQRKGMLDALGPDGILSTIQTEDDPDDPATLNDVKKYYGIPV